MNSHALAYLPDYLAKQLPVAIIDVEGCPYSCHQNVSLVVNNSGELSWLDRLYDYVGTLKIAEKA